jgi:hypothetical protein
MRDGVLTSDYGAAKETGADVMREVCVYGGEDRGVFWDAADGAQEVDGGFEGAREEAGTLESQLSFIRECSSIRVRI